MQLGAYESWEATANLPEPTWPDVSFQRADAARVQESVYHVAGSSRAAETAG